MLPVTSADSYFGGSDVGTFIVQLKDQTDQKRKGIRYRSG